jgi:hypothetical protein
VWRGTLVGFRGTKFCFGLDLGHLPSQTEVRYPSSCSMSILNDRRITLSSMTRRGFVARGLAVGALARIPTLYAAQQPAGNAGFSFAGQDYFYRWTNNILFEFTPHGQSDLQHWTDLVSIVVYRNATNADGLLAVAKSVLGTNKQNHGVVISTRSTPSTPTKPAEHYICVVLSDPTVMEAVFQRFVLIQGVGYAMVYSHRIYGQKVGDQMSPWIKQNGASTEKLLMSFDPIPTVDVLNQWKAAGAVKD